MVQRVPELVARFTPKKPDFAEGYHAQVHVDDDTSLLFLIEEGKRIPIRWRDGRFFARDRSLQCRRTGKTWRAALPERAVAASHAGLSAADSQLRGRAVRNRIHGASQVLYENLLGRMPVIYPRNSFTLLDARATKLLDRYAPAPSGSPRSQRESKEQHRGTPCSEKTSGRVRVPAVVRCSSSLTSLQSDLVHFDPTLETAAKKSAAKILYQIDKLSQKTARETMRRDERAAKDAGYLMNLIYPQGHLQERFYSIVPFLAKFGFDLPERLLGANATGLPRPYDPNGLTKPLARTRAARTIALTEPRPQGSRFPAFALYNGGD